MREPDKQFKGVVLVGKFNPVIFQPSWFSSQGLIKEKDADSAEVNIIQLVYHSFCKFI